MKIRINEDLWRALASHLMARTDVETAAVILAEPVDHERGVLVVREWRPIPDDGYLIRRIDQLRIDPVAINRLTRRARDEGLSIVTIHTHPSALDAWFSQADDAGDDRLLPSFASQVPETPHGSMVLAGGSGSVVARLLYRGELVDAEVSIVGRTLDTITRRLSVDGDERFARQQLALGTAGQAALRALRVGVVGLGGVGSVVAVQLGHLGVGELVLVDGDLVEQTNVSRILGVRPSDVGTTFKVEVARRYLAEAGMPVKVHTETTFLRRYEDARRTLARCDLVLACVDRHTPRALLNRLAYDASLVLIDMGSGFRVNLDGHVVGAAGRVVVVGPGRPCLACWGHLDPDALREEALPEEERATLVAAGYVSGASVPQPSVMPFNTAVAGAAVIELLRVVTNFAGGDNPPQRLSFEFTNGTVKRNALAEAPCGVCGRRRRAA